MTRLEALARQKVDGWRNVLRKRTPQTRQVLSKLLPDKLVSSPSSATAGPATDFQAREPS